MSAHTGLVPRVARFARVAVAVGVALAIRAPALVTPAAAAGPTPPVFPTPGVSLSGLRPLTIMTVPPIAGVTVELNGVAMRTGPDGTIHTVLTRQQREALVADRDAHLTMTTRLIAMPNGARAQFHGWYDGGYHFSPTDYSGQIEAAAFDVDYLTSFAFVDSHQAPVDRRRVTGMQMKDTLGATIDTRGAAPVWLRGKYVVAAGGQVTAKDNEYRLTNVTVSGVNAVRRGQQSFAPSEKRSVSVALRLFTVEFRARDALFHRATGSAIDIKMGDGTTRHFGLHHGSVTVAGLPPGEYEVRTHARGLGAKQTFEITGDQTADIEIIAPIDIAVAIAAFALIAGGLVLAGRRMRRRNDPQPDGTDEGMNRQTASAPPTAAAMTGRNPR